MRPAEWEALVLEVLHRRSWLVTTEVAREMLVTSRRARQVLGQLEQRGVVRSAGSPRRWAAAQGRTR